MGLELELDRDGPSNDERALRLEQERARELSRELELQKDTISLDRGLEKVDALSDISLQCLSETELDFIKREISEFAFIKTGNPANIQELEYDPDRNLVLARCNGRSLQIELDKEGFEKPIEVREKLSELQNFEQKHEVLVKDKGHLEDMVRIATDQRDRDILMREIKIEQASQGLMGVWNKLTGQIPEPYPSLYEQPLTHDDLARSLLIADVRTDHFQ
ncbi:hypothetical protein [Wohlfahrtiimonas populi]|uniref:hypothetical protein n=1 Tax=Wohlfahrtiimonas populi TaxID=1940240 RepID=UPI00098D4E0F|nr:hypothetical protein [Wohlfahrtiimonas populi]